ncbi:MAG: NAD-dependent epimerase/dehydratase family protein [Elusimicrobiota bacterium]
MHLVTGGSGYVGSFIAHELLRRGESVRVVDLLDPVLQHPRLAFHKLDVLDAAGLRAAMTGVEYVHHTAALVPLRKAGARFWEVNVRGTENVLTAAREAGVKHFSHMGSSAVFGAHTKTDCPITESTRRQPIEIYGRSKLAGEDLVLQENERHGGMTCSIIRPRTIVGTERLGIFQVLFEWLSEGRAIYIIGDGSNVFQFVHIDDIVAVSVESALKRTPGIFNIGTDRYGTLREALENLSRHAATGSRIRGLPVAPSMAALWALDHMGLCPLAPWHYRTYHKDFYFDLKKPFRELSWRPKYSNDEMLAISYDWYMKNKKKIDAESSTGSAHRSRISQRALGLLKRLS